MKRSSGLNRLVFLSCLLAGPCLSEAQSVDALMAQLSGRQAKWVRIAIQEEMVFAKYSGITGSIAAEYRAQRKLIKGKSLAFLDALAKTDATELFFPAALELTRRGTPEALHVLQSYGTPECSVFVLNGCSVDRINLCDFLKQGKAHRFYGAFFAK